MRGHIARTPWAREMVALAIALLSIAVRPAPAESDEPAGAADVFPILFERNIFDSERTPERPEPPEVVVTRPAPMPEQLRLGGVFISDEMAMGFFDGTRSEYDAVVFVGESVGGLQLVAVDTGRAVLHNGNTEVVLPVGAGLEQNSDGNWRICDAPVLSERTEGRNDKVSERSADRAEQDGSAPDLLERLRRRREQELNNE